ncbi:hypothetical protein PJI17_21665 [Mycobacterium kansasii]|uniref:Uncharacterized protein n=2 Tax=Mycobacterium kansasii TaxID=1768 RepID=A0A7G1I663_MYCKA|nr:hypothetical protein I547_6862 [Mycobacterium kansasii 824]BCI85232.1 hypothetical protein NIIDMKKI_04380 [Mycobacterium kansasii]
MCQRSAKPGRRRNGLLTPAPPAADLGTADPADEEIPTINPHNPYDADVATPEDLDGVLANLKARVAAVERSQADYRSMVEAIKAFGETQQLLADVLRGYAGEMRATADDSNQRIRSLETSTAEIKNLLTRALER